MDKEITIDEVSILEPQKDGYCNSYCSGFCGGGYYDDWCEYYLEKSAGKTMRPGEKCKPGRYIIKMVRLGEGNE